MPAKRKVKKAKKKAARTVGRPLKELDPRQVEELAKIQCTLPEMAAVLGCSRKLLERRRKESEEFRTLLEKGYESGKESLRRAQWNKAVKAGDRVMLIWLGKQYLGQTDRQVIAGDEDSPIRVSLADLERKLVPRPRS